MNTVAVVGETAYTKCSRTLHDLFSDVVVLPEDNDLGKGISTHPDAIIGIMDDKIFVSERYISEKKAANVVSDLADMTGKTVCISGITRGNKYPLDVGFSFFEFGKLVFANCKYLAHEIIKYAESAGKKIIDIKQGYASCTSRVIGKTIITGDPSVIKAASDENIDVLEIDDSDIILPPFKNGFIGGATGSYEGKMFVFGEAQRLGCFLSLQRFLTDNGFEMISLFDCQPEDLGGLRIYEKV